MLNSKRRIFLVFISIVGLCAGTVEYFSGRPIGSVYLTGIIHRSSFLIRLFKSIPQFSYGILGQWLPSFFHTFSFILLSITLFSRTKISRYFFCFFWLGVDLLFETGQRFGPRVISYIPGWFDKIPILENTKAYFLNGRFDLLDIFAIFSGGLSAFLIGELILGGERYYETKALDSVQ
jgi:hypothetical protein